MQVHRESIRVCFFFQAEDGIRDLTVTGVQTCALPISARLMERMRDCACTVMQATPALWRALVAAGWSGSAKLKVLCGGEALPPDLAQALLPRCAELWNMYGPTETTVWSTLHPVASADARVPIGLPIANTQVFVLDANRQPTPPGVAGQLCIGGDGVARGYPRRDRPDPERLVSGDS